MTLNKDGLEAALLPCPFCESQMAWAGGRYHHPDAISCPLVSASFRADTVTAWNRRATPALPAPDGLEVVAYHIRRLTEDGQPLTSSLRFHGEPTTEFVVVEPLVRLPEAATVIQTLQRERDEESQAQRLTEENEALRKERDNVRGAGVLELADEIDLTRSLKARIKALEEALSPFARVGDILELRAGNRPSSDDDPVTEWEDHRVGSRRLTVGDFRRARLLLKEGGE